MPPSKKQRVDLGTWGRQSAVSAAVLAKLLDDLGYKEPHGRHTIRRARLTDVDITTPYGKLFRAIDVVLHRDGGNTFKLKYADPAASVWHRALPA